MNLAAALFANARQRGFIDVPALLYQGEKISYAALDCLSNQAANLLGDLHVRPGERVLILLRDTPELIALFLGAVKAGVVPVVLSTRISPADFGHALSDSAAAAVFIEADFVSLTRDAAGSGTPVHERSDFVARLNSAGETFTPLLREQGDAAFWVCSSGSTSRPKSVVHTHGGVAAANGFHREHLKVDAGTRIHCTSKLSFAYPLSNTFLGAMDVGASVVLYPDWHDPESLLGIIERYSPEVVFSTPTLYRRVLHAMADGDEKLFAGVWAWVSAGEHLPEAVNESWRAATGNSILDCYGTSETLFLISATPPGAGRPDSAGRAVPGAELELRDPDGDLLSPGEIGEMYVRHPFLASGYANNSEQTERRFRDGWFATGDLFLYDADDFWYFRGREDSRVKIAGQWVHLQDVENAVSEEHSVKEVAAVSVPDEDGLERIALFIVCEPDMLQTQVAANVEERLQQLPTHKRPRWLQFTDSLPRTNTGKIKRHELRPLVASDESSPLPAGEGRKRSGG